MLLNPIALRYFTLLYFTFMLLRFYLARGYISFLDRCKGGRGWGERGVGEAGWVSLLAMGYREEERVRKVIERDVCV